VTSRSPQASWDSHQSLMPASSGVLRFKTPLRKEKKKKAKCHLPILVRGLQARSITQISSLRSMLMFHSTSSLTTRSSNPSRILTGRHHQVVVFVLAFSFCSSRLLPKRFPPQDLPFINGYPRCAQTLPETSACHELCDPL
jgi:hypothetical protein